ncbi:Uridine nucleosidase 1 [Apiotrichum porosum]|uniref:Uridine nucleosidase 1 n=1 Tax=Apiotrichum porosum TaxID=105984 RepID=A0A427XQK7_9TREE|nr:Uridine nucleosidase 1 [Apiotrichum porosum]RSH81146.1 Uridine nucleosidase 1 [Apiotrichum porosum]
MSVSKIILDCDPGHDDAVALLLAWGSPAIDLVAVTTVAGNQTLAKVTRNALAVARVAGIPPNTIPFAAGADRPLVRVQEVAAEIHGASGMDGPALPEPNIELDKRHAIDVIIDTVMSHPPGEITLVPTGTLTNIALAVRKEPRIAERVKEVVLMGGAIVGGNWSPCAEFNIVVDPEAAEIVFSAGWKVVMVGLDVTHKALATAAVRERILSLGTKPAKFADELFEFFKEAYRISQGFDAPPVHDPCAVAYVIDPTVFTLLQAPITVETQGKHTVGMTVVDTRYGKDGGADCKTFAATGINVEKFWDLVVDALQRIGDPEQ